MSPATTYEIAIEKAQLKRALATQLQATKLAVGAQRDVLADLLLSLDGGEETKTVANGSSKTGTAAKAVKPAKARAKRVRARKPRKVRAKAGRPHGTTSKAGDTKTEAVVDALKANRGLAIVELAKLTYPEEADGRGKLRAILASLKKQGRANNFGTGKWEATTKP
jgi:hypothetical protein